MRDPRTFGDSGPHTGVRGAEILVCKALINPTGKWVLTREADEGGASPNRPQIGNQTAGRKAPTGLSDRRPPRLNSLARSHPPNLTKTTANTTSSTYYQYSYEHIPWEEAILRTFRREERAFGGKGDPPDRRSSRACASRTSPIFGPQNSLINPRGRPISDPNEPPRFSAGLGNLPSFLNKYGIARKLHLQLFRVSLRLKLVYNQCITVYL